jgi:hypothetical protein
MTRLRVIKVLDRTKLILDSNSVVRLFLFLVGGNVSPSHLLDVTLVYIILTLLYCIR